MCKKNILYHIIYILFTSTLFSQDLHLKISGTDSISTEFTSALKTQSVFNTEGKLLKEVEKIKNHIFNSGYFFASFKLEKKDSTYFLNNTLNTQFKDITINYNKKNISKTDLNKALNNTKTLSNNSFTIPVKDIQESLQNINSLYTKKSKLFTSCYLENIQLKKNSVIADLKILKSTNRTLDGIRIKGYTKFPKSFIKHHLNLKNNTPIHPENLNKKTNNINTLPFALSTKKPELLFTKDSTIIYLTIKQKNSNTFNGILGFSSDKSNGKIKLNGNANLKLINNLHKGEELHINYNSSENEQKDFTSKLILPYLFKSPISLETGLSILKKDSSYTNTSQNIHLNYSFNKNIQAGAGIQYTNTSVLTDTNPKINNYKKTDYQIRFKHQAPNLTNNTSPYKTKTILNIGIITKNTHVSEKQNSLSLSSFYIFNINTQHSVFIKSINHYLFSNNTLDNELQYIGGINTIRGFKENSIPSKQHNIINLEYRVNLTNNLHIHTVTDFALNKATDNTSFNKLLGFGLGFSLQTNNNILRLVFANNKTKGNAFAFSDSKIHLSLSALF